MKEKLATTTVGILAIIGLALFIGEAQTDLQEVINKVIGVASLASSVLLYKLFEKKGVFDATYEEYRKECLTYKE